MNDLMQIAKTILQQMEHRRLASRDRIWWQGSDGELRGPASVQQVALMDATQWVWVEAQGIGRWISEKIIVKIEKDSP